MTDRRPVIGEIVHFRPNVGLVTADVSVNPDPYPAIVTHVWSETCVNLTIFNDGTFPLFSSDYPKAPIVATSVSKLTDTALRSGWFFPEEGE